MPTLPFIHQRDAMDCGPTCLAMLCRYYGKSINLQTLRDKTEIGKEGVNLLGINNAAESIGFRTQGVQLTYKQLTQEAPLPCMLHWGQNHFVVLVKVKVGNRFLQSRNDRMILADPGKGIITLNKKEFLQNWLSTMAPPVFPRGEGNQVELGGEDMVQNNTTSLNASQQSPNWSSTFPPPWGGDRGDRSCIAFRTLTVFLSTAR